MRNFQHESDDILIDDLAEEFAQKCRSGGCPSITHYALRYPDLAAEINELFPAIALMEQFSHKEETDRADTRRLRDIDQRLLDRLGDYRIVRQIGRGGMGLVYEAIQESLGRTVALKVLAANVAHAPTQLARFQREAQAAAMLHHTNIVPIFGVGQDDGLHYYVMQYIDGVSLDRFIAPQHPSLEPSSTACQTDRPDDTPADDGEPPRRPLSWQQIADYGAQIAQAVDYAHHQGVLHRDIKPANLLVDKHGTVWITDFGLAKVFGDEGLTQSGDVFGTIRYMAPEQFEGKSTRASDIYSIGVTLYELLTEQPAFTGADAKQLMRNITQQGLPHPRSPSGPIPKDLETIILKAAAFDPRHRYESAGALAEDLHRFQIGEPIAARRASLARRLWGWSCRNPALAALSGLSALLLLLVAAVALIELVRVEEARKNAIELAGREKRRAAELRVATKQAQTQSDRAREESQRAEDNLQLAMLAFEDVIARVAGRGLPESLELDLEDEAREGPPAIFTDDDAELLQSLLTFYEEFATRNRDDESVQLETAKAHHRIGDIRLSLGQFEPAAADCNQAIEIYQRLAARNPAEMDILLATVEAWNQLGVTFVRSGRVREAIDAHLAARDLLLDQPTELAQQAACRFALAVTYNHLGAIWYRANVTGIPRSGRGRPPFRSDDIAGEGQRRVEVLDWMDGNYHSALRLLQQLIDEDPENVKYRLALARCYRNGLPLAWHGGSADEAAACLTESVTILQQLVNDFPDTPRYAFELADVLSIDTAELRDTEFGETSWQRLERAEEIARKLNNAYPNQPEYKTLYANALYRLGLILRRADHQELAVQHLTESLKHYQELLERFPTVPAYVGSLGRVALDLGTMQREDGELQDSYDTLDDAILRLIATYDPTADMRAARRSIAILQLNLNITSAELHGGFPRRGEPPGAHGRL